MTVGVPEHAAPEMARQHLRAETDAKKRLVFRKRHLEPVDLAPDEIGRIVHAHGTAEDNGAGMLGHGRRQRISQRRPAHVERVAALTQGMTDPTGRRSLLMHDDQNRLEHDNAQRECTA
jgi:hypothetical protein